MKKLLMVVLVTSLLFVGCQSTEKTDNNSVKTDDNNNVKANEVVTNEETSNEDMENNPVAGIVLNDFETEDYSGNKVTSDIFKDKKITVLNLWADWCGPCVEEMPDFEKVAQSYKDKNVQIIGLAVSSDESAVNELKESLSITYPLIKENNELQDLLTSKFDYVPATLFVDSEGKILSTFVPGSISEKDLKATIEKLLNE